MQTKTIQITAALSGRQIRAILERELCFSRRRITRIKLRETGILLNGVPAFVTARVQEGDTLVVETGDDPARAYALPNDGGVPLPLLFEDEDLIVINKPAGLPVHASGRGESEVTVESALAAYLPAGCNPHPVSRLDRGTTGVMVLAKSGYMHDRMRRLLSAGGFQKEYRAVAVGHVAPGTGVIDAPIGFAPGSTYQRAVCTGGQPARTKYETLAYTPDFTLLRLVPETGRTHQLRVHMAHLGFPLAGDFLYGTEDPALIPRPALHAYRVSFVHPATGQTLRLTAPVPADMLHLMDVLHE